MAEGWIKLHRKLEEWEWIDSHKHLRVFLHLLLNANHKENTWRGIKIAPGQIVTGRLKLARKCNLSEQNIRTVLKDLNATSEVTIKSNAKYSIITIVNWDDYQDANQQTTNKSTNKQPTSNQQVTTNKNEKNVKNEKNISKVSGDPDFESIISHLNKQTGKKFSHKSKKTQSLIRSRKKDGFKLEDFITVIDAKCSEWLYDGNMSQYLRPETLFGTKFESYLQAYIPPEKKTNPWSIIDD